MNGTYTWAVHKKRTVVERVLVSAKTRKEAKEKAATIEGRITSDITELTANIDHYDGRYQPQDTIK